MQWKVELSKLLRMDSSNTRKGESTTFEEYVSRMKPDQKEIYYLCTPSRIFAEESPYYESFREKGIEVLFLYDRIDDFVMSNVASFDGKKLVSLETSNKDDVTTDVSSNEQQIIDWFQQVLSKRVYSVKITKRLVNSPAIVVDHESSAVRRMMRFVDPERSPTLPKQTLEVNPKHPIIVNLMAIKDQNTKLAEDVMNQIMDNALIAAGLLDDPRQMLPRLNLLLESVVSNVQTPTPQESTTTSQESTTTSQESPQPDLRQTTASD